MQPPSPPPRWPNYLIEAGGLGLFMVAAGLASSALDYPRSALHELVGAPLPRRLLIGLAMGGTALGLIYSPWGARSGAHFNPALTLTFALLGKIGPVDAVCYALAQCAGGLAGVLLVAAAVGLPFTLPPVQYVLTLPGPAGAAPAFALECLISSLLMAATLILGSRAHTMRYTGACCALLIVLFVTVEAPYSGMSMNPARSLASAAPAGVWRSFWIYLTAPPLGMLLAALAFRLHQGGARIPCAKLNHDTDVPCHFACAFQSQGIHVPALIRSAASAP